MVLKEEALQQIDYGINQLYRLAIRSRKLHQHEKGLHLDLSVQDLSCQSEA